MVPHIVSNEGNITLVLKGGTYNVPTHHENYAKIKDNLSTDDPELLLELIDTSKNVTDYSNNNVEVRNGVVYFNGEVLHNTVTDRILSLMREGFPFEYMLRFLENLMDNPSRQSVDELYDFLAHTGLPITEDGHFLAYKGVRTDYKDKYSGKFDNSPGNFVEIKRNLVDDRREHTCSHGLHVGAFQYAKNYAGSDVVVLVKVNPRDAVSVPYDHDCQKLRVSRYEVLERYEGEEEINGAAVKLNNPNVPQTPEDTGELENDLKDFSTLDKDYPEDYYELVDDNELDDYEDYYDSLNWPDNNESLHRIDTEKNVTFTSPSDVCETPPATSDKSVDAGSNLSSPPKSEPQIYVDGVLKNRDELLRCSLSKLADVGVSHKIFKNHGSCFLMYFTQGKEAIVDRLLLLDV